MKKTKVLLAAALIATALAAGAGAAYASANKAGRPNFMGNIANAIAAKFNLNASEVQAVVDEQLAQQKQEQETQREKRQEQSLAGRLAQAVSDEKLTQEQADMITAKKAEIDGQLAALKDQVGDEAKEEMQSRRTLMESLKQWATDNGIPQEYLMFGFGGPMGGNMRGGFNGPMDGEGEFNPPCPFGGRDEPNAPTAE